MSGYTPNSRETLTSLDINFGNSGGSHTASTTSVFNAKDLSSDNQDELGSLIGSVGGRTTFTNDKIQTFMNNFIEVEHTISKDSVGKTISRKFEDRTSLILQSHVFVVRGRDVHPKDETRSTKEVYMPYFSECSNSPITNPNQKFPGNRPVIKGGVIFIGKIYNEESSILSSGPHSGEKISLVYQDGVLQEDLCHNLDYVTSEYYKLFPDYANYNLKYGYTLEDAKLGLQAAGVNLIGMPNIKGVLLETSGTLEAVISDIAAKFGYYWFVDPFAGGAVRFVDSRSASMLSVFDPFSRTNNQEHKFINASLTTNHKQPRIVNAFNSTIEKRQQTFEFGSGDRFTRFVKFNFQGFIADQGIPKKLFQSFYGLHCCGKYRDESLFNAVAITLTGLLKDFQDLDLDWGDYWKDSENVPARADWYTLGDDEVAGADAQRYREAFGKKMNLDNALFIRLFDDPAYREYEMPSKQSIYKILQLGYNTLTSNVYVSHRYNRWKARRMSWQNSSLAIDGPFKLYGKDRAKLVEADGLQDVVTFLKEFKITGVDTAALFQDRRVRGEINNDAYGFIGVHSLNKVNTGDFPLEKFKWDQWVEGVTYQVIEVGDSSDGNKFLAIDKRLVNKVIGLVRGSVKLWDHVTENQDKAETVKVNYVRSKKPLDEEEDDIGKDEEKKRSSTQAGLNAIQQRLDEVRERFDIRYFSLKNNGASGNILNPVKLDIKSGSLSDVKALESASGTYSNALGGLTQASSRTLVGFSLPSKFKMTISSLSLRLGSEGVTTTINESTLQLLRPDDQLIIDKNSQAHFSSPLRGQFTASQKNFLSL